MPRTRARKQRSRKNRTRRGGDSFGPPVYNEASIPQPIQPPIPVSSTYSSPVASTSTGWLDKIKKSFSWSGGKRKRRGGFKPYDPLQSTYGSGSAKGGRRRKSRKSRKSRR